jgi:SAM-dependent methyltransferase
VVGVGTGQDLAHLPAETEVTGIDLSPAMLARARSLGTDATPQEMNAEHLGFPDDSFDVVLLSYVRVRARSRSTSDGAMGSGRPRSMARRSASARRLVGKMPAERCRSPS